VKKISIFSRFYLKIFKHLKIKVSERCGHREPDTRLGPGAQPGRVEQRGQADAVRIRQNSAC
jgi:hypothetical protein